MPSFPVITHVMMMQGTKITNAAKEEAYCGDGAAGCLGALVELYRIVAPPNKRRAS